MTRTALTDQEITTLFNASDALLQLIYTDPTTVTNLCRTNPELVVLCLKYQLERAKQHDMELKAALADKYNFALQEWMATYRAALMGYAAAFDPTQRDWTPAHRALAEAINMHGPKPTVPK